MRRRGSLLLLAPLFSPSVAGGLQHATIDLARGLEARGWQLTIATASGYTPASLVRGTVLPVLEYTPPALDAPAGALDLVAARAASVLPIELVRRARLLAPVLRDARHALQTLSRDLASVDRLLRDASAFDLVVLIDYPKIPGLAALAADRHPRVVVLSLMTLVQELQQRHWKTTSRLGRLLLRGGHDYLFTPVRPGGLRHVVFASDAWRDQAMALGIDRERSSTIYFGREWPERAPPPTARRPALLFAGRLAPDKGLHLLLPGFAALLARRPDATLTIVAGPGRSWYRIYCERLAHRLGVAHAIDWRPAVPRDTLDDVCRGYGALLHYSGNEEPVALMLLHAIAAGLPIVTARPPHAGVIVIDGHTCLCYDADRPESIAHAADAALADDDVRERVTARAFALASRACAIDAMIDKWDRLLLDLR